LTGTVQNRGVAFGADDCRPDANMIFVPSGVQPCTVSAPGCHVSRTGSPPLTGTT